MGEFALKLTASGGFLLQPLTATTETIRAEATAVRWARFGSIDAGTE
jgi:hypothetical protein